MGNVGRGFDSLVGCGCDMGLKNEILICKCVFRLYFLMTLTLGNEFCFF